MAALFSPPPTHQVRARPDLRSPSSSVYANPGLLELVDQLLPPTPPPVHPKKMNCSVAGLHVYKEEVVKLKKQMEERLSELAKCPEHGAYGVDELVKYQELYDSARRVAEIAIKHLEGGYLVSKELVPAAFEDLGKAEAVVPENWKQSIDSLRAAMCEQIGFTGEEVATEEESAFAAQEADESQISDFVLVERPPLAGSFEPLSHSDYAAPAPREFLEKTFMELKKQREACRLADQTAQQQSKKPSDPNERTIAQIGKDAMRLYERKNYRGVIENLQGLAVACKGSKESQAKWACYDLSCALHILGRAYLKLAELSRAQVDTALSHLKLAESVLWEALNLKDVNEIAVIRNFEAPTLARLVCVHLLRSEITNDQSNDRDRAIDLLCLCVDQFHLGLLEDVPVYQKGRGLFDPIAYVTGFIANLKGVNFKQKDVTELLLTAGKRCAQLGMRLKCQAVDLKYQSAGGQDKYIEALVTGKSLPPETKEQACKRQSIEKASDQIQSAAFSLFVSYWVKLRPVEPSELDKRGLPQEFWVELNMGMALLNLGRYSSHETQNQGFDFATLVRRGDEYAPNLGIFLRFLEAAHRSKRGPDSLTCYTLDLFRGLVGLPKGENITAEHLKTHGENIAELDMSLREHCADAWTFFKYNFVKAIGL